MIHNSLADLDAFIKETKSGLGVEVQEGDYDGLVEVMGHLLAVRDRQAATDVMFEPLKQTIDLLKTYEQEMSDEVHQRLQELPEQWNVIKKQAVVMKQNVAPLQANEVNILRRKVASFDVSHSNIVMACDEVIIGQATYIQGNFQEEGSFVL